MTCSQCSRAFDLRHLIEWSHLGASAVMHPNYTAELAALRGDVRAEAVRRLRVGQRVRVTAPGDHHGHVGTIVKKGRTRFHVRAGRGVLTVPFGLVEPARLTRSARSPR
jgi:hypothetical protein